MFDELRKFGHRHDGLLRDHAADRFEWEGIERLNGDRPSGW